MPPAIFPSSVGTRFRAAIGLLALMITALVLSARNASFLQANPTTDLGRLRTEAVATFAASLTRTAGAAPTATLTITIIPSAPMTAASASPECLGLAFLRDVSIPDNTEVTPAQVFTKTWLVENSGGCAWRPGFQLVFVGGLAMGGSPFRLERAVPPGARMQVSIKMAAPTTQTGVVQGTWKMSDDNGAAFGDYLSVVLVVTDGRGTPGVVPPTATP